MKPQTKQARQNKRLAELLGMNPEDVQALRSKDAADDVMREAQAIFLFIEKPEAFISKKCDECKNHFLTTYQFVSVCSTDCRIKSLERIGIEWNPLHTPEERWKRSKIPTEYSIPPKALAILIKMGQEQGLVPSALSEPPSELPEPILHTLQQSNDVQESQPAELPIPASPSPEELLKELGFDLSL